MSEEMIIIPSVLIEELRKKDLDPEDVILDALVRTANLDPDVVIEARVNLANKYLGKELVNKDPVQASEKLYKAAEECVKALAQYYDLKDILVRVSEKGRWTVTELEKTVLEVSKRLGNWFGEAWDRAWALHVWGFHEAKFDAEDIMARLPYVQRIVEETSRLVKVKS
ncbi:PaREP1 family protein [Vulcanisaeta moutnovskia]|nr:PaREP1 family protein [Vulcanisaeta moutnovskia]